MEFSGISKKLNNMRLKSGNFFIFSCIFLYVIAVAASGLFNAEQKFLVDLWGLEYATASMSNTFYFVAYGLVQVVLSIVLTKINVKKYMLITITLAGVATALVGISTNIYQVWIFYGLCGAFKAGVYCGCYYFLSKYLPAKQLTKANTLMTSASAFGSVTAYGLSAFFVGINAWRVPYFIIAGLLVVAVVCFGTNINKIKRFVNINKKFDKLEIDKTKQTDSKMKPLININSKKRKICFYIFILLTAFLFTAVYTAVMNYITSLLVDVHGLSQDVSIYVTIIAPVAVTLGPILTINLCEKHKDYIKIALICSIITLPVSILLAFLFDLNVFVAISISVFFVVLANGIKFINLSVVALKVRNQVNAGSYTAITNAVASLSAGVTATIIGRIIDVYGWQTMYTVIFILVIVIVALLIVIDILVRKQYRKDNNIAKSIKI